MAHAVLIQLSLRSPPSATVGTADSTTMKDAHGNTNATKKAMLLPMKLHTTATPLTATAPK